MRAFGLIIPCNEHLMTNDYNMYYNINIINKENMKKFAILGGLFLVAGVALAAVSVSVGPTSLVTSATAVAADSEKAVIEFTFTADAAETLSSVAVTVDSATAVSADLANVSVFMDDGDGSFDSGDMLAGSNTTVNIGSVTTVTTASNNAAGKFFVVLKTAATGWASPDSVTVTLATDGIVTSANSPTVVAVTTAAINADSAGPVLTTAVAQNTGGTAALEAGDRVLLTFGEATNKATIDAANIDTVLVLNNTHSWKDGAGALGSATWNTAGTELVIVLSAGTSVPTVAVGDTVTVTGSVIKDAANNNATGDPAITGDFGGTVVTPPSDDDDEDGDEEEEETGKNCGQGIRNGRLYKIGDSPTVYLAAACRLKPFRGAAVFHARGHKFQNITVLASAPTGIPVTDLPALPAGGTLVQGTDATVWFVTNKGKKKGFTSENAFRRLGFAFGQVKKISDSDLGTMSTDAAITENDSHPDGSIIKCGNSAAVFEVKNNTRFPFPSASVFEERGHSFSHLVVVDCGRFAYVIGLPISNVNQ